MLTSWFLFAILICGFSLYDLIDPALKNSLEQLEDGDNCNNELQVEDLNAEKIVPFNKIIKSTTSSNVKSVSYDNKEEMNGENTTS